MTAAYHLAVSLLALAAGALATLAFGPGYPALPLLTAAVALGALATALYAARGLLRGAEPAPAPAPVEE